jgi:hypothetical protein
VTGWSKRAGGLFAILLMIVSWIASGELVQGLTPEYPHPFAICFCTRLGWSCLLIGWVAWRYGFFPRAAPSVGHSMSPLGPFSWWHYVKWSAGLSMVGLVSGWTWYISLDHTPLPVRPRCLAAATFTPTIIITHPACGHDHDRHDDHYRNHNHHLPTTTTTTSATTMNATTNTINTQSSHHYNHHLPAAITATATSIATTNNQQSQSQPPPPLTE